MDAFVKNAYSCHPVVDDLRAPLKNILTVRGISTRPCSADRFVFKYSTEYLYKLLTIIFKQYFLEMLSLDKTIG